MKPIKIFTLATSFVLAVMILTAFVNRKETSIAKKNAIKSDGKGFAVVELFTSEGCSSCPPADELVARIQKENKDKPVYILAFHVDYWNRLGWKDVFSSADYSKRQNEYAKWLNLQSVYTPQIVVNGQKEFVGSQQGTLRNAIIAGLRMSTATSLTLSAQTDQKNIRVKYMAADAGKNASLVLALIQKSAQTNVKNGENGGRTLSHVQIVRNMRKLPLSSDGNASITRPADFNTQNWEIIGLVQNNADGKILAAAKSDFGAMINARK